MSGRAARTSPGIPARHVPARGLLIPGEMADDASRAGEPLYPPEAPQSGEPARRQKKVRELPASVLRPRDKLIRFGAGGMSQSELRVGSPAEAYALVRDLKRARKEHLVSLYLDAQNRLICRETVSIGSLNTTRTHPREVLQPAIVNCALAFILVHNHPSGSLDPSRDDVEFTRTMSRAGELMGISLYDHLIVSQRGFVSLKERGLL